MKKIILSLVLSMCAFSLTAIAGGPECEKAKGECPKQEGCEKAKKDGGCCKEKQQEQAGKKAPTDQAKK